MPRRAETKKIKTNPAKSGTRKGPKVYTKKDVLDRNALIKQELNYFKGISIFLIMMLLCLFVSFGALFSAMYYETKLMRMSLDVAFGDVIPDVVVEFEDDADEDEALEKVVDVKVLDDLLVESEVVDLEWLNFEKYDFNVSFPNSWTYLDRPFQAQVHFYSDGSVRELDSVAQGDFIIAMPKLNNYKDKYQATVISLDNKIAYSYNVKDESNELTVVVIPTLNGFFELRFKNMVNGKVGISKEIMQDILDRFELKEE